MEIRYTYKGKKLTGFMRRYGVHAGGTWHFFINGKQQCKTAVTWSANDLDITTKAINPLSVCKNCRKVYESMWDTTTGKLKVGAN